LLFPSDLYFSNPEHWFLRRTQRTFARNWTNNLLLHERLTRSGEVIRTLAEPSYTDIDSRSSLLLAVA
jgi:hypothetical protein